MHSHYICGEYSNKISHNFIISSHNTSAELIEYEKLHYLSMMGSIILYIVISLLVFEKLFERDGQILR
jgi:hypothetical protein